MNPQMTYRRYLRNPSAAEIAAIRTDEMRSKPIPPVEKPFLPDRPAIDLAPIAELDFGQMKLIDAIRQRRSRRKYSSTPLSTKELSFLLWATQGVKSLTPSGQGSIRTVPSGGGLHPFETYLVVMNVEGLDTGLYRYLAVEHKLYLERKCAGSELFQIGAICDGQNFVATSAVVFIWTVRCARTEWRYGKDSLKDLLISVGHICQNLYLSCETIGAGTCAILAYQQDALERFIGVDGDEEIPLYLAPVGRIGKQSEEH